MCPQCQYKKKTTKHKPNTNQTQTHTQIKVLLLIKLMNCYILLREKPSFMYQGRTWEAAY